MLKKTHYFSHSVGLNIHVFTLSLKRSVLAPVSLRTPPEKAQSSLIGWQVKNMVHLSKGSSQAVGDIF